jgi:hypothetical protein
MSSLYAPSVIEKYCRAESPLRLLIHCCLFKTIDGQPHSLYPVVWLIHKVYFFHKPRNTILSARIPWINMRKEIVPSNF